MTRFSLLTISLTFPPVAPSEMNKDQGLGFLVLRKRITFTLVTGLLIQTVSGMVVISTTLMSIATGKTDVTNEDLQDDQIIYAKI